MNHITNVYFTHLEQDIYKPTDFLVVGDLKIFVKVFRYV